MRIIDNDEFSCCDAAGIAQTSTLRHWICGAASALQCLPPATGATAMSATASTNKFTVVPPEIWAALRLKPGAPVRWEVRGDEAVMRPASAPTADDVFGMLRKHVKPGRNAAPTVLQMRAAAKAQVAKQYRQSQKDAA